MKKILSFFAAVMAVMSLNATDYYLAGEATGWSANNEKAKFVEISEGLYQLTVADLYGGFKITEGAWHPQYGAAADGEGPVVNGAEYTLVKCDDSEGEKDAPANANVLMGETEFADPRVKDAIIMLAVDGDELTVSVSGSLYDHAAEPIFYYLIGACTDNWSLDAAIKFEEVSGVLTANVPLLEGGFKIIYDRKWGTEYASNGAGVAISEPYALQLGGGNLSLANPFGGYKNAVLTLTGDAENLYLTLVSGDFYVMEKNWYVPGSVTGWNLNETTQMELVEGTTDTFEFLAAEFGGDFKIVYGNNWDVEFGSQKPLPEGETALTWAINADPIDLYIKGDNLHCAAGDEVRYEDVIVTIVVDYESANVQLTLESEKTGVKNVNADVKAVKRIINGQMVIEKNGVRYNTVGAAL